MTLSKKNSFLDGLQQRVSHPRLTEPAPSKDELSECYQAAFRSPDHAWLRPWRFIECRGDERQRLGDLLADAIASERPDLTEPMRQKLENGPMRAPLVVICYAKITEHPKVPAIEQVMASSCAAGNFINALSSLGYGAVWRSGDAAHSSAVSRRLNLSDQDVIVGYLYVGTPQQEGKEIPVLDVDDFVTSMTAHFEA